MLDEIRAAQESDSALDRIRTAWASPSSALDQVRAAAPPPVPMPRQALIPKVEKPPELEQAERQVRDVKAAARFQAGIDPDLEGNYPAKAAAIASTETPLHERPYVLGRDSLAAAAPGNFADELRDVAYAVGTGIVRGIRALPAAAGAIASGTALESIRDAAVAAPEAIPRVIGEMATERGIVQPDDPRLATTHADRARVPLPGTDRVLVPRLAAEFASERPFTAALDASLVAAVPGVAARGAGEVAIRAGAGVERVGAAAARRAAAEAGGPVPLNAAERAGGSMARAGVAAQEAGEALREIHPLSVARRAGANVLARSPGGNDLLYQRAAAAKGNEIINRSADRSIATRIADQGEIEKAVRTLGDEPTSPAPGAPTGAQVEAAVIEGRASRLAPLSPREAQASETLREIRERLAGELRDARVLGDDTMGRRVFAPWVNVLTGRRIPPREWDDARVALENSKLEDGVPRFLSQTEYRRQIDDLRDFQRTWNELPEDTPEWDPAYFPRFPTGKTDAISLRKVAAEFFPTRGRQPGKQPFQKAYTGLQFLKEADPADVREALVRYNAQVRRVVDSKRMLREIETATFERRLPDGTIATERLAKPLHFDKRGEPIDLLPGHRPFAPKGMLQFYRKQLEMGDEVVKALEDTGEIESAVLGAIKDTLAPYSEELRREWLSLRRRREILQVPESVARQIERHFGETHPLLRVWDKATDAWKAAVLAYSPRWYVNNLIGNTVLHTMAGGSPRSIERALHRREAAAIPPELAGRTMARAEGYVRDLGQARTSLPGAVMDAITNMRGVRMAGSVTDRLLDFNALVDNHFRSALYLDIGRKEARNALVKRTGRAYFDSRAVLEEMVRAKADPKRVNKLLDSVDRVFVNFNNLTPFERQWIRRVVPFWTWYREIARVSVSLPKTSPVRFQIARALAGLAQDADEREFEERVGVPKALFDAYLRRAAFVGVTPDGEVEQVSTRGLNPFAEVLAPEFGMLHPALVRGVEEWYGGRNYGGGFVPFRTEPTGRPDRSQIKPGMALRAARQAFPPMRLAEDFAQKATEGMVTQRYEDVTPLENVIRKALGEPVVPTAIYDFESRKPRREKPVSDTVSSWAGIPRQRFLADEQLEQQEKDAKRAATDWARNSFRRPEHEAALRDAVRENAGQPYEGLRTFQPESR